MLKDRYIFALLLCACMALVACDAFEDDDEDEHFPDRAPSANNLLRHYYDSNTWPEHFTAIKIPEGSEFEDNELDIEMPMGGTETVTDVRVRLYVIPPAADSDTGVELQCRVKAPDGTTSAWQSVDFEDPSADGLKRIDPQAEVRFLNEFDGVSSGGDWLIQLRDPVKDEDGRAIFRNATLRINGGLPTGSTSGSETQNAALATNPYDEALPFLKSSRYEADIASLGVDNALALQFTFTGSFNVESFSLDFTVRHNGEATPGEEIRICILTPSGGWYIPTLIPDAEDNFDSPSTTDDTQWLRYVFSQDRGAPETDDSFIFLGEPAGGTWTVLLWEIENDGNLIFLSDDRAFGGALSLATPASLSLG